MGKEKKKMSLSVQRYSETHKSLRSVQVVISSLDRDSQLFPSYRNFSIKLLKPIRHVHAIQLLQTELFNDVLDSREGMIVTLNGYEKLQFADQKQVNRPPAFARVFAGRQSYSVNEFYLTDAFTYVFEAPEQLQRFDVSLNPITDVVVEEPEFESQTSEFSMVLNVLYDPSR
jgi:hypothetical protein